MSEPPVAEDDASDLRLEIPDNQGFPINEADGLAERHAEIGVDLVAEGLRIANWWLKARRLREDSFGPGLFADPAWDILLDLYSADARGECVQISSLALAARVPHSTAIRWAKIMTGKGLIDRHKDPRDDGRIFGSVVSVWPCSLANTRSPCQMMRNVPIAAYWQTRRVDELRRLLGNASLRF
jgi:hypothetical protein